MLYKATLPVHTLRNSRPDEPLDEPLVYWARTHGEARDGVIDEAYRRRLWYDDEDGPEVTKRAYGACSDCDSCWPAHLLTIADDGLGVLCHACAFGEERWRPVSGYPGYEVSDIGRVRSWKPIRRFAPVPTSPRIVSGSLANGYLRVSLSGQQHKSRTFFVHRLVAEAFIGSRPNGMHICHINGIRNDNRFSNLRYGTQKENYADAVRHGTATRGERAGASVLTMHIVDAIRFAHSLGRFSVRHIARELDVSEQSAYGVTEGRTWLWLPNRWEIENGARKSKARGRSRFNCKITERDVCIIRARAARGEMLSRIAKDYNISSGYTSEIAKGNRWRHVPMPHAGEGNR